MRLIVGIDPDVDKNGVAVYDGVKVVLYSMPFSDIVPFMLSLRDFGEVHVFVEGGWLNKGFFHLRKGESSSLAAKKGWGVGRNHQTGMLLVEVLKKAGIDVDIQKPFKKCWKGKDGKITHEELARICPLYGQRSNQEERDAALIAWVCAGKPIKLELWKKLR